MKLYKNLLNSFNGFKEGLKEHSFILEILGGLFLIPYLVVSSMDNLFKLIIVLVYFMLLALELLNTAIEKLSDKITKKFDPEIKKVKDLSSSSVFVILILLLILLTISLLEI